MSCQLSTREQYEDQDRLVMLRNLATIFLKNPLDFKKMKAAFCPSFGTLRGTRFQIEFVFTEFNEILIGQNPFVLILCSSFLTDIRNCIYFGILALKSSGSKIRMN